MAGGYIFYSALQAPARPHMWPGPTGALLLLAFTALVNLAVACVGGVMAAPLAHASSTASTSYLDAVSTFVSCAALGLVMLTDNRALRLAALWLAWFIVVNGYRMVRQFGIGARRMRSM
jgi:divalent metal cation (Fe/Co/Zn/Cd) transporter